MRWIAMPFVIVDGRRDRRRGRRTTFRFGDELIAYQGNGKIYVINADGSDRRPIISNAGDISFAWSPDAQHDRVHSLKCRVAFSRSADAQDRRCGRRWHWRAAADPRAIGTAASPTWSPDGKQIAFEAWNKRGGSVRAIYVIGTDGNGLRMLTHRRDDTVSGLVPGDGPLGLVLRTRHRRDCAR